MNAVVKTIPQANKSVVVRMGERFGVDPDKMMLTLKSTCFRQRSNDPPVTNEEMMALMVVADQYNLNPFTKEIYAFLDKKRGGIVPVVSIDGWARIINERPELDGIEFTYSPETIEHNKKVCHVWIDCTLYRKDRSKPTVVREFFAEVVKSASFETPWDTHPNRMHRHKALIQCARIAFSFAGIYDPDEAERIIDAQVVQPQGNGDTAKKYISSIADILAQDIEEDKKAVQLSEIADELNKNHELYSAVFDGAAKEGILSKSGFNAYLDMAKEVEGKR